MFVYVCYEFCCRSIALLVANYFYYYQLLCTSLNTSVSLSMHMYYYIQYICMIGCLCIFSGWYFFVCPFVYAFMYFVSSNFFVPTCFQLLLFYSSVQFSQFFYFARQRGIVFVLFFCLFLVLHRVVLYSTFILELPVAWFFRCCSFCCLLIYVNFSSYILIFRVSNCSNLLVMLNAARDLQK